MIEDSIERLIKALEALTVATANTEGVVGAKTVEATSGAGGVPITLTLPNIPISPETFGALTASPEVPPAPPIDISHLKPTPEVPVAPSGGLDIDGYPWDERIHSSGKTQNKKKVWNLRRGVDRALVEQVRAETIGSDEPKVPPAPVVEAPVIPEVPPAPVVEVSAAVPIPSSRSEVSAGVIYPMGLTNNPNIGRVLNGVAITDTVAIGMEAEYVASLLASQQLAAAAPLTLDDVREAMMTMSNSKGAMAVVTVISQFGETIDAVPAERYRELLTALEACPDLAVPVAPVV